MKNMNCIKLNFIVVFFLLSLTTYSQNQLQLLSSNKNQIFNIGDRVGITKKGSFIISGELEKIDRTSIMIKDRTIQINDIQRIGYRKKGTTIKAIATAMISGFILGYSVLPNHNSTTERAVGATISLSAFIYSLRINKKNKLFRIKKKSRLVSVPIN
jgi:hypothetical protein